MDTEINPALMNVVPLSTVNSFHVHVSSKASSKVYPHNTGQAFTYQCPEALIFPVGEEWECALLELVYDAYGGGTYHTRRNSDGGGDDGDDADDGDDDVDDTYDTDDADDTDDIDDVDDTDDADDADDADDTDDADDVDDADDADDDGVGDVEMYTYSFAFELWNGAYKKYHTYELPRRVYTSVKDLTDSINIMLDEIRDVFSLIPVSDFLKFHYERYSNTVHVLFGQVQLEMLQINIQTMRLYFNDNLAEALGLPKPTRMDVTKTSKYTMLSSTAEPLKSETTPGLPAEPYEEIHIDDDDDDSVDRSIGEILVFMSEVKASFFRGAKRNVLFKGSTDFRQSVRIPEYVSISSGPVLHELTFNIEGVGIKHRHPHAVSLIKLHFRRAGHHGAGKF